MLFDSVSAMASQIEKAICFYSTGKDSTVMLDLMAKAFGPDRLKVIHLYMVPDLSYKLRLFDWCREKYGIEVIQEPSWEVGHALKKAGVKAKAVTMGDQMRSLRAKYEIDFCAFGWLRSDSMARAIVLKTEADENLIDWKYKKLYPIGNFTKKDIDAYVKREKLLLSSECYSGFRNIDIFKGESALWLKNNYPDDWKRALEIFPYLEGEVLRVQ